MSNLLADLLLEVDMNIIPPEAVHFLMMIISGLWSFSLNIFLVGLGLNWSVSALCRLVRLKRILQRHQSNSGLVK